MPGSGKKIGLKKFTWKVYEKKTLGRLLTLGLWTGAALWAMNLLRTAKGTPDAVPRLWTGLVWLACLLFPSYAKALPAMLVTCAAVFVLTIGQG